MIRRTFATRIPRCAPSDAPSKAAVQRLATLDEAGNQALRQARQGGDCCYSNSNASVGTFYEGAIVAGYPSDATDEMVQANVIATKYGSATAALETSTATGP